MLLVVTHQVPHTLQQCQLTYIESKPIDIEKATRQHRNYRAMLEECGTKVIVLDDNLDLPDSVFVEDPIVVFDEVAVMTTMGVKSRRQESTALQSYFRQYRRIEQLSLPARIEGGDILKIGKTVFIGHSKRTDKKGIEAMAKIIEPLGYKVIPVEVRGCLHLKTGCSALDNQTVLINPEWVEMAPFVGLKTISTLPGEPFAANILPINDTICMNAAFPKTVELIISLGYRVATTDISEFVKAEAGLTCMCIPFNHPVI